MIGHRKKENLSAFKRQMAAMMNMKLKHVLILSITFCIFVYFVDQRLSSTPEIHPSEISEDGASSRSNPVESSPPSASDDDDDAVVDVQRDAKKLANASNEAVDRDKPDVVLASSGSHADDAPSGVRVESGGMNERPETAAHSGSNPSSTIHVVMVLKDAAANSNLQRKFDITVASIFRHSSLSLQWHVFGDDPSLNFAQKTLDRGFSSLPFDRRQRFSSEIHLYKLADVEEEIGHTLGVLMKYFTGRHTYYKHSIFFLSTVLHELLDPSISRVIMIDADLKFMTDIKLLHDLFDDFSPEAAIGIGYEMQPVYRHLLWSFRNANKGTMVGEPVGSGGNPGFNSGVLLLDLDKLRSSQLYESLNQESTIKAYVTKYSFDNAHLGDQDFFTVTSFEHPEFYHRLPCAWNRQLCRWWEDKGYKEIFHEYFDCPQKIQLYHGNCDTPIPA